MLGSYQGLHPEEPTNKGIPKMKTYRLAAEREFELVPFGPLMTLSEAESYRDQLVKAGKLVHVINATAMGN